MSELARIEWRKSSHSINGECVEMAPLTDAVAVRDSKDATGPVLLFSTGQWHRFVRAAARGALGSK